MRAEASARAALRTLHERPSPGLREHPGRRPRPNPDRPSLWRCEHPVWRHLPSQPPLGDGQRLLGLHKSQPVFQSAAMPTLPDQANARSSLGDASSSVSSPSFASVVRHELVNPLNALSGWLHLLAMRPAVSEEIAVRALDGARRAVDQQLVQIEMLSRVLQLSVPGATLDTQPVALLALMQQCCEGLKGPDGEPVQVRPVPGAGVHSDLQVRAHGQALAATLTVLLGHVALQGTPQAHLSVDITPMPGQHSLVIRVAPARAASESTWSLPWTEGGAAQTRSLEWLHAQAVIRAMGARIELLPSDDHGAGIGLMLPALEAQSV